MIYRAYAPNVVSALELWIDDLRCRPDVVESYHIPLDLVTCYHIPPDHMRSYQIL